MSTTIIKPKSREEWLEIRKNGIGSSEVGTILGFNPFETPLQLWRRKRGIDPPKEENFAMRAGHYLEDAVSQFYSDATGREVIKSSAGDWIIQRDDKPFMQVSPDRTFWLSAKHSADNKGILECKTTQKDIDADDLPKHWVCQLQYQLGVAEMQKGSLAWLTSGREFGYKDIDLIPDFYALLCDEVEKFYRDNIIGGAEPKAINVTDILLKYNRSTNGKAIEVGDDVYDVVNRLKDVKQAIKDMELEKDKFEAELKMAFADAEVLTYNGTTIATWKSAKDSQKFQEKLFAEANPEKYAEYLTTVPGSRRLLIK